MESTVLYIIAYHELQVPNLQSDLLLLKLGFGKTFLSIYRMIRALYCDTTGHWVR